MPVTRIRYVALWLIVAAYMINHVDRLVFSFAAPVFQKELAMDVAAASLVLAAFRYSYVLFQIPGGWLADRIGPRRALALAVIWWSVFASASALAWNATSLAVFRFLFGVGQAGMFAIATRSLSHWMLPIERGWAQGVNHAGMWLTAYIAPGISQPYILSFGWRTPVFFLGLLGLAWAAVWFFWYRDTPAEHSWINPAERDLIQNSLERHTTTKLPLRAILSSRTVWTLSAIYFCYGYGIAAYLLFPAYLKHRRGLDLTTMGWDVTALVPAVFFGGSLAGGWLSDRICQRTGSLKLARQSVAITGFLLAATSIVLAAFSSDVKASIIGMSLGGFGLALTVAVSWAVPLDVGRDFAGTVAAVMNTAGNIGGAISVLMFGYVAQAVGGDYPFFPVALLCVVAAMLFTRIDASRPLQSSGKPDRLPAIEQAFHEALARPKAERRAFLEESCVADSGLIREIESLLWRHDQGTARFEGALGQVACDLLTAARVTDDIHQGSMLGPYRIDYKLGEGGMGSVHAATDTRLDRRVAVKMVNRALAGTPEARAHFLREARSAAALAHANIAVVHDLGETDEIPWIVMEYIAGTPLRSRLQNGPVMDSALLKYAAQLAAALEHAHARRIIHRDIKPENIIITEEDDLKVIDFGLARAVNDESAKCEATNARTFVGTVAYSAPEIVTGGEPSSRSDIYSAGMVIYEMAYGQHPFAGLSGRSLVAAILSGNHPVMQPRNTPLGPNMDALIERCLSLEPDERYRDGADLAGALRCMGSASLITITVPPGSASAV